MCAIQVAALQAAGLMLGLVPAGSTSKQLMGFLSSWPCSIEPGPITARPWKLGLARNHWFPGLPTGVWQGPTAPPGLGRGSEDLHFP